MNGCQVSGWFVWQLRFKLGLVLVVATLLLSGCFGVPYSLSGDPIPVNPPDVPTSDLLLDESPFPSGWQIDLCEPYCDRDRFLGESSRTFGRIGIPGHIIQDVFYYRTERDAEAKFQRYDETTGHSPPPEISYLSPIADEQYLRCGVDKRSGIENCRAARRYGNYFIYFYFDLDQGYDDGLPSIEDVEPILRAMDERVSEQLGIPLPLDDQ